jgi:hypothetical protein
MQNLSSEGEKIRSLRRQRNLYAILAVVSIAAIGFAVPRKLASYRELKSVNDRLVKLQAAIVANQDSTREVQRQILEVQQDITKRLVR